MRNAALLGIAAVAFAACAARPDPAATEAPPIAVSVARVETTNVPMRFEAGGVVRARTTALIASQVMAPIAEVRVRPGDRVRKGAVLITLDVRDHEANRSRAQAGSLAADESAQAAGADVRVADATLALAQATHQRIATLHAKRSATAAELDQAVAALAAADAQRTSAAARLAAANAQRDEARASVQAATVTVSRGRLLAPFDGMVAERRVDPGSMAAPGTPLLVIEDPSAYRLEIQLDESRAALLRVGQEADVRIDTAVTEAEEWIRGPIREIARVNETTHSFLIKIDLPPTADVRSGLFARARFAGPSRQRLTAPASALVKRGQLTFVYLLDSDNRIRLRPIAIGAADGDRVEVLAGLQDGAEVVATPSPSLADGARVARARP